MSMRCVDVRGGQRWENLTFLRRNAARSGRVAPAAGSPACAGAAVPNWRETLMKQLSAIAALVAALAISTSALAIDVTVNAGGSASAGAGATVNTPAGTAG